MVRIFVEAARWHDSSLSKTKSQDPPSLRADPDLTDLSQITRTFWASSPFFPGTASNSTCWPSSRLLYPSPWMAEKCTKTSSPCSREMNPNPFSALKNFTVPCATNTQFSMRQIDQFDLLAIETVLAGARSPDIKSRCDPSRAASRVISRRAATSARVVDRVVRRSVNDPPRPTSKRRSATPAGTWRPATGSSTSSHQRGSRGICRPDGTGGTEPRRNS